MNEGLRERVNGVVVNRSSNYGSIGRLGNSNNSGSEKVMFEYDLSKVVGIRIATDMNRTNQPIL